MVNFINIFKYKQLNVDLLLKNGFSVVGKHFEKCFAVKNNQFLLMVNVNEKGLVQTQLVDVDTNEEYVLHLLEGSKGAYAQEIASEVENILKNIAETCFENKVFKSKEAEVISCYVKDKYGVSLEFLWPKFPANAVARRPDNQKWFLAILTAQKDKVGLKGKEIVEMIDLRGKPDEIATLIDGKTYFPAYHMNKKNWYTILLNESVSCEEIISRIDESFLLAKK